jgi:uncharacterized membrane protein YbhN (UPF0104 family)
MLETIEGVLRFAVHAARLLADRAADVDLRWLVTGLLVYLLSQAVRTRGWYTIVRAAYPEATDLRARDVMRASLAGQGTNVIVPAHGGDAVKLAMLHRRIEGSSYTTLAATLLPETLFESACAIVLMGWALAQGFLPVPTSGGELPTIDVSLVLHHPVLSALGAAVLAGALYWLVRKLRGRLRQGLVILRRPRLFVTGVASWQALSRVIRLGSLAAFLAAFSLPVTPATVVLVMAAQGGGRIIPLAPASAGLRLAMLSYGFVEITGRPIDIAAITAFTFGVGAVVAAGLIGLAAVILLQEFGTLSPRSAVAAARSRIAPRTEPAPAPPA